MALSPSTTAQQSAQPGKTSSTETIFLIDEFEAFRRSQTELVTDLFLSGVPESYAGFELVIDCEKWPRRQLRKDFHGLILDVPFTDDDQEPPLGSLETASEAAAHALRAEKRVLVHCTAGINRGALVAAMILKRLGFTGEEAVRLIRVKRDEHCLCNETFERIILETR